MLADRVLEALDGTASVNNDWGIDHGIWSVLCNMYPKADIPVIMISTDTTASPKEQYETGKKLAQLRDEGALILASGNIVHNLGMHFFFTSILHKNGAESTLPFFELKTVLLICIEAETIPKICI